MKHALTLLVMLLTVALTAVEVGPYKVTKVVDGDTIWIETELGDQQVRLLYIDTPESSDNAHGKKMPEGIFAKEYLTELLLNRKIRLQAPGKKIERDRYNRILAVPYHQISHTTGFTIINGIRKDTATYQWHSVCEGIIANGHSPYWRKYGDAEGIRHTKLLKAHTTAQATNKGCWATARKYMQDKSNERTAAKNTLKAMDKEIIKLMYQEELKKNPTHTHWLNNNKRHNKKCRWFGLTKDGKFSTSDAGIACKVCEG
ncbi:MAG: thermonuclease family protein [Planctomycetes bacterium]|nr:thermonuclease family protein [Planctomycetota bacterium]